MINFNKVKAMTTFLLESDVKPSELYSFFRSFDEEKAEFCDVMQFNRLCGFTSHYKDVMNKGNDLPEWLTSKDL